MNNQTNTKFHELYLIVKNVDEWCSNEERTDILTKIKSIKSDNKKLVEKIGNKIENGIVFKAIGSDTKFDNLYNVMKNTSVWFPIEKRTEILKKITEIFEDYKNLIREIDSKCNTYGICFKTIGEDSSFSDIQRQYFETKEKRDAIWDDWNNGVYWDDVFDNDVIYRTPSPNLHDMLKFGGE